jgi:hypothetical protein
MSSALPALGKHKMRYLGGDRWQDVRLRERPGNQVLKSASGAGGQDWGGGEVGLIDCGALAPLVAK